MHYKCVKFDKKISLFQGLCGFFIYSTVKDPGDYRNEKIGFKIREAQMMKIPFMFVVGEKEVETQTVALRKRGEGDQGVMAVADAIALVQEETKLKK